MLVEEALDSTREGAWGPDVPSLGVEESEHFIPILRKRAPTILHGFR